MDLLTANDHMTHITHKWTSIAADLASLLLAVKFDFRQKCTLTHTHTLTKLDARSALNRKSAVT